MPAFKRKITGARKSTEFSVELRACLSNLRENPPYFCFLMNLFSKSYDEENTEKLIRIDLYPYLLAAFADFVDGQ